MTASLTTTSYATLGLLALGQHWGYELSVQSKRSPCFTWPVVESWLYAEDRRLVTEGQAMSDEEPSGSKPRRTMSRTTSNGRATPAQWVATEPGGPRIEIEVMLRVLVAGNGTRDDLLGAIAKTRASSSRHYQHAVGGCHRQWSGEDLLRSGRGKRVSAQVRFGPLSLGRRALSCRWW